MSTPQAGVRLLSALRRAKSKSALYDTPSHFFVVEEERTAYEWLVDFVETHNAWPSPQTVERETGIKCIITKEPINFYREKAREHSQWEAQLPLYTEMRDAFRGQDPDKVTDLARQMITLAAEYSRGSEGLVSLKASIGMVVEDFDIAKRTPGLRGIPTGYEFMDEQTDGLQNANLYTTVARPGRGKTYKLLKQALAARTAGYSVLFLTNEMGVLQVARRFFGMETSINPRYLREGRLSSAVEAEMRRQAERMQDEEGPNFFWLAGEHGNSVEKLKAAAYASEPDLIIADASYLMKPSDRTKFNAKHEIVGDVMRGLHALGVSINRPVSQSVQFNRLASTPTKKKGEDEEDRDNPLSHMGLEKIAGTDEIGQLSAYVEGIDLGDAPNQDSERYAGALKGREGETGWYKYHYKFNPFNMEQMYDHRDRRRRGSDDDAPPPDMSFMDAA